MQSPQEFYAPDIAAKAVEELTLAMHEASDDEYAKALLADPRMTSNRGHLASCGISMREVKQAKLLLLFGMPTLAAQQRAVDFLNRLDQQQRMFDA